MPFSFCFSVSLLVSVSLSGEGGTGTKAAAGGGEEEARGGGEEAAGRDCASAEISRWGGQDERKAKLSGQCRSTTKTNMREYQLLADQWHSQSAVCQWILSDITCTFSVLRLRKCLKKQVFTLISELSLRSGKCQFRGFKGPWVLAENTVLSWNEVPLAPRWVFKPNVWKVIMGSFWEYPGGNMKVRVRLQWKDLRHMRGQTDG